MKQSVFYLIAILFVAFLPVACTDDETDLGIDLQDPSSLYKGNHDTITAADINACTIFDSNLLTSGYYTAIVGNYHDATYGDVHAKAFCQVAISGNSGINFTPYTIDSVVLSLVISERYPETTSGHTVHLKINQLAEEIDKDSNYHASDAVGVSSTCFADTSFTIALTDTVIRIKMNSDFTQAITSSAFSDQADFMSKIKGLCLEIVDADSDPAMITFDMAKENSCITVHYSLPDGNNTYKLLLGYVSTTSPSNHFCQFTHTYSGQLQQLHQRSIDSIDGSTKLYMEPLGGTGIKLNINNYVKTFHERHPRAVIHYAELLLPVASDADNYPPQKIIAYKTFSNGSSIFINDYLTAYNGYDGTFDNDKKLYRIRITQHLQQTINQGVDYGTSLFIDGRRSSARRTIFNGPLSSDNPIKIAFIYSE